MLATPAWVGVGVGVAPEVAPVPAGVSVAAGSSWLAWGDKGSATTFLVASVGEEGEGLAMVRLLGYDDVEATRTYNYRVGLSKK